MRKMKNKAVEIETIDRRVWESLREFRKNPCKEEYLKKKQLKDDLIKKYE
ncbi:MAG: hypothetical protein BAJALOKI2v1_80004 [Promethearchaeota archaeon]|nr:MAG: hypothetical protein BAJALOKI2v1_80004 [Candidatus Lokiarchaeota archaeon]